MKKVLNSNLCLMLFVALMAFLFMLCSKADASNWKSMTFGYAPFCKHFKSKDYYNESNNHAFLLAATHKSGWRPFVLTFRNSYYDRCFAAGLVFRTKKWMPFDNELFFRANLLAGIIHGYGDRFTLNFGGFAPIAAPSGELGYKKLSLHLMVTPAVASVMLAYQFDFLGR